MSILNLPREVMEGILDAPVILQKGEHRWQQHEYRRSRLVACGFLSRQWRAVAAERLFKVVKIRLFIGSTNRTQTAQYAKWMRLLSESAVTATARTTFECISPFVQELSLVGWHDLHFIGHTATLRSIQVDLRTLMPQPSGFPIPKALERRLPQECEPPVFAPDFDAPALREMHFQRVVEYSNDSPDVARSGTRWIPKVLDCFSHCLTTVTWDCSACIGPFADRLVLVFLALTRLPLLSKLAIESCFGDIGEALKAPLFLPDHIRFDSLQELHLNRQIQEDMTDLLLPRCGSALRSLLIEGVLCTKTSAAPNPHLTGLRSLKMRACGPLELFLPRFAGSLTEDLDIEFRMQALKDVDDEDESTAVYGGYENDGPEFAGNFEHCDPTTAFGREAFPQLQRLSLAATTFDQSLWNQGDLVSGVSKAVLWAERVAQVCQERGVKLHRDPHSLYAATHKSYEPFSSDTDEDEEEEANEEEYGTEVGEAEVIEDETSL